MGLPGKVHDARVFRLSPLSEHINACLIAEDMHLVADSAYGLQQNIITSFRDNGHLTVQQRQYNNKLAGIRSSIERTFGLLKNKFLRLRYIDMNIIEEIPVVVAACCVLHNFVIQYEGFEEGDYIPDNLDEVPDLEGYNPMGMRNGEKKRQNIMRLL